MTTTVKIKNNGPREVVVEGQNGYSVKLRRGREIEMHVWDSAPIVVREVEETVDFKNIINYGGNSEA